MTNATPLRVEPIAPICRPGRLHPRGGRHEEDRTAATQGGWVAHAAGPSALDGDGNDGHGDVVADLARFLRRFRRLASPPGRAGPAAVPLDRDRARSEELEDLFAAIDEIGEEAERVLSEAEERCAKIREDAETGVSRLLDHARSEADAARADESVRRRAELEEERRSTLDEAREEASGVRARAQDRLEDLAQRIVRELLELRDDEPQAVG